jgi:hypothetical protein
LKKVILDDVDITGKKLKPIKKELNE